MGGEREKGDQIKNFYNVNRSKHRASDRLQKKSQISRDFQRQIHGKNGQFCEKFSGQISLESDRFRVDFMNIFNETKPQFCQFFFFFGGGEVEMMSKYLCNDNNKQKHQLLIKLMLPFQNRRF